MAAPATANDETRPRRRHRRFPSTPSRTSNNSVGSGAAAAADASNSNPNNPRLRRLQRLRLSSSLQQKALLQKRVEAQENDDFANDLRYSSDTLEGMLLRIPSGSLTATSTTTGSSATSSSADSSSDGNNATITTTTTSSGGGDNGAVRVRRENVLQMARRKVTPPRRTQQQRPHTTNAPSPPAPFHRVDSAVSSLGCSKFTDSPDEDHNIDAHGVVDEEELEDALPISKLYDDDAVDSGYIPGHAIVSSFEQIREDIDSFEKEAAAEAEAAATATIAKHPLVVGRDDLLGLDDELPRLCKHADNDDDEVQAATPAAVAFSNEDDNMGPEDEMSSSERTDDAASRTPPSCYCTQPHLLAGPEDELSYTQNLEETAASLPPPPPPSDHHRYEEMGRIYRTPGIPTDHKALASDDASGPNSPMSVAEYDNIGGVGDHSQPQKMPSGESFDQCLARREKIPVHVRSSSSIHPSSKDADDVGELPSLSLCSSPYSSYEVAGEEQPFDAYSNSFAITVTDADETPFDEGSSVEDCDLDDEEENPFDESRPISPLSHPGHKSRPTARNVTKSAHVNRQVSTASDLAYSLPDNDLIIDFDPQLIERKNASLIDGPHNITMSDEEEPTFLESLTYTKSDGRLTPETYNGKHMLSRSYGRVSPSGDGVDDEASDEPSI